MLLEEWREIRDGGARSLDFNTNNFKDALSRQFCYPMQSDLHSEGVAEVEYPQPKITGFARHSTQLRSAAKPTQAR
ncbi:MAG: hypothetical protein Q8K34_16655 [Hydrogenophaga sp.]|nr:hypothetical protein [Hydrogenophaga sp.]MDP2221799.1 hypothetical protein [Hydrogenophaga sp.]